MGMKKISIVTLIFGLVFSIVPFASATNNPTLPVNEPLISAITSTSATFSVPSQIVSTLSTEQQAALYFEYIPTQQVCIMIYPTPENCLPKKTTKGNMTVTVSDLKPNTSYTVSYKVDNTIMCITAPCPGNGLESSAVVFTTLPVSSGGSTVFSRNLSYKSRGPDVVALQDILRARGYLFTASTGYFGIATFKAVKAYQRAHSITPTGFVGLRTRALLNTNTDASGETFEGTIQAASTACYADGICSVTIDGKVVITTIGWTGGALGSIKGTVTTIGDIATNKIGAKAKVYAQKTAEGYTLYGNTDYYIEVF